ncbi:MAG: ubiquitin-like domain-containing protein, partial [Anaerolineales bacterium]
MNKLPFIFLASALALTGIFIVSQGFNKTITLKINGNSEQVETKAWTVSSLLAEQELLLREQDSINPSVNAWITGGETITVEQATWVTITADGKTIQLFTRQSNPKAILAEAGINLSRGDQILIDGLPVADEELVDPVKNHSLQVRRMQSIELIGSGGDEMIRSNSSTVGDALWEKGIDISIGDRISVPLDSPLDNPITVEMNSAQDVTIRFKSGSIKIQTAAETVGEALAEAGFPLQGLDFSRPEANSPIPEDGKIQVIRVRENLVLESEPIP